jgi:hypothetical protein
MATEDLGTGSEAAVERDVVSEREGVGRLYASSDDR